MAKAGRTSVKVIILAEAGKRKKSLHQTRAKTFFLLPYRLENTALSETSQYL